MDSGNVFELFSQAVNEGDIVKLDKILNYFKTYNANLKAERSNSPFFKNKSIPMDFITKPVNEQYGTTGTCLEVASRNGHWDILRILLQQFKYHVYEKRDLISNPPFNGRSAVVREKDKIFFRDICSQIPITKLVENLISFSDDYSVWLEFILDALMSSSITRADKIVALELMGAVFIFWWSRNRLSRFDCHLFETSPLKGIQCWKDALILRDATADGEPAIPNIPCVLSERLQHIYGNYLEEMTSEDLELWDGQNDHGRLRLVIQALFISHKILSEANPGTLSPSRLILFYHENLWHYAQFHTDFNQVMNIVLFILETCCSDVSNVVSCSKHLSEHFDLVIRSLFSIEWIEQTFRSSPQRSDQFLNVSAFLLEFTKSILKILSNMHFSKCHNSKEVRKIDSRNWTIFNFLSSILSMLNQQDRDQLINYFSDYIGIFKFNRCFTTFLRVAMADILKMAMSFSKVMTIFQFFLDAGVDPNETNYNGRAPIHILAKYSAIERVPFMLKSLLNAGAHIDQATPDGQTIGSILNQQRLQFHLPSYYPFESLADNPLNVVLPLSCYCAQSIRRNGIPYQDQLPVRFHEIVSIH